MQPENPYAAPASASEVASEFEYELSHPPKKILGKIRAGWIAAIVSGALTTALWAAVAFGGLENAIFGPELLIDVVVIFGLAIGIFFKSRIAATLMFVYFLASKIFIIYATDQFQGGILGIVFLVLYFNAMVGTFQYHKWKRNVMLGIDSSQEA